MLCITVTLAALLGQGAADWYSNQTMGNELSVALNTMGLRSLLSGELSSELADLRLKQRGMMLYAMAHDSKRVNSNREEFQDHLRQATSAERTFPLPNQRPPFWSLSPS